MVNNIKFDDLIDILKPLFNPVIESKFKLLTCYSDFYKYYVLVELDESGEEINRELIY